MSRRTWVLTQDAGMFVTLGERAKDDKDRRDYSFRSATAGST
jgi:hypothetical protein